MSSQIVLSNTSATIVSTCINKLQAQNAALLEVAEAASRFMPYAYADDIAPNGKAHAFENLQAALDKFYATQK